MLRFTTNTHRLGRGLGVLVLLSLFNLHAGVAGEREKKVDYLGLAGLLIQDGKVERADMALASVDVAAADLDRKRYFTLRGLVDLKLQRYPDAIEHLHAAQKAGQDKPILYVYLAQSWYGLGEYAKALAAIDAAGATGSSLPGVVLLAAQCHWAVGDHAAAWDTLNEGAGRFPSDPAFPRQQVFRLIQLGLYQQAVVVGRDYLQRFDVDAHDHVAIGSAMRQAGQAQTALSILEPARLRFPNEVKAVIALARTYVDLGRLNVAADLMEQAAAMDPQYLIDAAELHRRAGHTLRALYLNSQVRDQKKKLKQRLALLLEDADYSRAAGMQEDLFRAGLLADEDIRYALAYAAFKAGEFARAEAQLATLKKAALFKKATALRKAMETCRDEAWRCL